MKTFAGVVPADLMSLADAALIVGRSRRTLAFQARLGVLQTYKIGRSRFVTRAEVERYAREHKTKRPGE